MSSNVPDGANEECVGPANANAGKAAGCAGCPNQKICASGEGKQAGVSTESAHIVDRMSLVKHIWLVLSGKGGVGKSTCAAQCAFTLASQGYQVGLLDVDICGPSIPRMLGLVGHEVHQSASGWSPVYVDDNLGVMSIAFMLPGADDAVIWRGPRKNGLINQFLTDVVWNELDYLIIDTPPGTSDEHITIVQSLKASKIDGAIIVTTPQEISMADVRKEINFCKKTGIPILGVIENMAGLQIPLQSLASDESNIRLRNANGDDVTSDMMKRVLEKCPELLQCTIETPLFTAQSKDPSMDTQNTPAAMASRFGIPYLGKIPMDNNLMLACERGESFIEAFPSSAAAKPFLNIIDKLTNKMEV